MRPMGILVELVERILILIVQTFFSNVDFLMNEGI